MKKWILFSLIAMLSSCQFDDKEITVGHTSVYFVNQEYNRNIVVGEGLELKVGVTLGGIVKNGTDRDAAFAITPDLITNGAKAELPQNYYSLSNKDNIRIPAGSLKGYVTVKLDSAAFLADARSLTGEYIIPVQLTGTVGIDKITAGKEHINISVSYFAKQHGNYTYNGTTVVNDKTVSYSNDASKTNSIKQLTTVGPKNFVVKADNQNSSDPAKGRYTYLIEVPTLGGGEVIISADPTSAIAVSPSTEFISSYTESTKTFCLHYKYTMSDQDYTVSDTLVFRNRIRDMQSNGIYINEWRGF